MCKVYKLWKNSFDKIRVIFTKLSKNERNSFVMLFESWLIGKEKNLVWYVVEVQDLT